MPDTRLSETKRASFGTLFRHLHMVVRIRLIIKPWLSLDYRHIFILEREKRNNPFLEAIINSKDTQMKEQHPKDQGLR